MARSANILPFDLAQHSQGVIDLWRAVFGYEAAHNKPELAIARKLAVQDGLFWVAVLDGKIAGTVMAGYDGHRGWIYSLAVDADHRHEGIGSALLAYAEGCLADAGCMKINLQIVEGNRGVAEFYRKKGYSIEPRVSMGKVIPANIPEE